MSAETFTRDDHFYVGIDPGQLRDFTAIAVVRQLQVKGGRPIYQCGDLVRLPLGTKYPEIADYVGGLMEEPIYRRRSTVVIDTTGVGLSVKDTFEDRGIFPLIGVTITAGAVGGAQEVSSKQWHVPKGDLITLAQSMMHSDRLHIRKDLEWSETLREELISMRQNHTDSGRWKYGAREGEHDDLVLALCLGLWRAYSREGGGSMALWGRLAESGGFSNLPTKLS